MKLIELHIYGYGKLEDYRLTSLNQLQVFYGENEAGKSTIMSFIHSILFGFPARQSAELRYEPKNNSKYGGKIKAFFPDAGIAVIERVKGKASGDVTVSLEDGTIGGEDLLKDLLNRMDKSIYQAIFSFNVHGLQNIQSMKGEELGKYLFSAGTLGTDKLFNTESRLLKDMEQRFKPGGKKPSLNEKLKKLKEVQTSLKNAEQQNEQYTELMKEKAFLNGRISQLNSEVAQLEQEGIKLRDFKRNEHLVVEAAGLQLRLDEHGSGAFPQDGLARFEKFDQQLKPVQARMLWIEEKMDVLKEDSERSTPNAELLGVEAEIESRLEKLPLYEQLKQEKRLLELKMEELMEEISKINDYLYTDFNEDNILDVNTSVFIKEQAEMIQHAEQRLMEKKLELESEFEDEKIMLAELEASASSIQQEFLAEEHRNHLLKSLEVLENKEKIQSDLNHAKEQIVAHKNRVRNEENIRTDQKKKDLYQLLLLGGIFLIVLIWGIANSMWLLATVGIAGCVILFSIHFKAEKTAGKEGMDDFLAELLEREKELAALLGKQPAGSLVSIKGQLEKDDHTRQRHRELLVKIEQQHARFERAVQQFEKWEMDDGANKQKKSELLRQFKLSEINGHIKVLDAYMLIEKQKQFFRERTRKMEKLKTISLSIEEMEASLKNLAQRFLHNSNLSPLETAALLKKNVREAIDQKAKYHELIVKMEELEEEYSSLEKEKHVLNHEKEHLLMQAEAADEEEFRHKAKKDEMVKSLGARIADLNHQLTASGMTKSDCEQILNGASLEERLKDNAVAIDKVKKELSEQFDRAANVNHKMAVLEEGGTYSQLLHQYKQLEHEFAEDAREWAKYAIAKDILSRTIDSYKDERMPRMLTQAERFLSVLTDGDYIRIIPQAAGSGFLIERKDHMLFEANELSQATAEQVYVSIRLALASGNYDRYPFPIIIDDSFVNFDHKRTERIIGLLREMSNNQILIFTCHRHLLGHFTENEVLKLEKKSLNIV